MWNGQQLALHQPVSLLGVGQRGEAGKSPGLGNLWLRRSCPRERKREETSNRGDFGVLGFSDHYTHLWSIPEHGTGVYTLILSFLSFK